MQDGDKELSDAIRGQFGQIFAALDAIEPPLRDAVIDNPDAVTALRSELKLLLFLLKVDMSNQMNITVTFTDMDGD